MRFLTGIVGHSPLPKLYAFCDDANASSDSFSPVFIKENDVLVRKRLGSYPLLGEKESLEALASSQKAYDLGRGEWPTMPVKKRIDCMLHFTKKMKEQKSVIVNYLMWEIGKSLKDSEKEFDRTVEYIFDTIEALKNLDRDSSKIEKKNDIYAWLKNLFLFILYINIAC